MMGIGGDPKLAGAVSAPIFLVWKPPETRHRDEAR